MDREEPLKREKNVQTEQNAEEPRVKRKYSRNSEGNRRMPTEGERRVTRRMLESTESQESSQDEISEEDRVSVNPCWFYRNFYQEDESESEEGH